MPTMEPPTVEDPPSTRSMDDATMAPIHVKKKAIAPSQSHTFPIFILDDLCAYMCTC